MLSRRKFILGAGAIAATGGIVVASGLHDTSSLVELTETKISIPNLPKNFTGYRIGFLSDLHLGYSMPEEWLEKPLQMLLESQIDLLLLGGDYIWIPESISATALEVIRNPALTKYRGIELISQIFNRVAAICSKPLAEKNKIKDGIFAVLGNHDHWTEPKICREAFAKFKINVLENQYTNFSRGQQTLELYGADDYWTGFPRAPLLAKPKNSSRILLTHNPDFISYLQKNNFANFDLALAGHTHGGQIKLPLLGAAVANIKDQRFFQGLFSNTEFSVYTSRGVGFVEIPFRINCPPEASLLVLESA